MKSVQALSAFVFLVVVGVIVADEYGYQIPEDHPANPASKNVKSFPEKVRGASVVNLTYVPKMSAVKNQTTCLGANGTMAVVAVLEYWAIKNNTKVKIFSDQSIVDCAVNVSGCIGGHPFYSLNYARQVGLSDGSKYTWQGKKGTCANKTNPAVYKLPRLCGASLQGDEETLAGIVEYYGPMVVMMALGGSDFTTYKSGVYLGAKCKSTTLDTSVAVVGYGTDATAGDYWIVRMNRGAKWGEKGYARVARGKNVCGIGTVVFGPC